MKTSHRSTTAWRGILLSLLLLLSACGGGGSGGSSGGSSSSSSNGSSSSSSSSSGASSSSSSSSSSSGSSSSSSSSGGSVAIYVFGSNANDGLSPSGIMWNSDGNLYGTTGAGGASKNGTIFKLTPTGAETVLYSFAAVPDGAGPYAGLIRATDGNFYGTTAGGGQFGYGTIFQFNPNTATEAVLHHFTGGSGDGARPEADLIQAADGNFYGTTSKGGTSDSGTVYKITPSGVYSILLYDGAGHPEGLLQGSDGNFYGISRDGGQYHVGAIFKITPTGVFSSLYSFTGGLDGAMSASNSFIQARDGNFYGTSGDGGASNYGVVWKITPAGAETVLYSFTGNNVDGRYPNAGFTEGSDGNFYGTTEGGGTTDTGTVYKITPAGVETVLHSFAHATEGTIPGGLIQGADGNLYGATSLDGPHGWGAIFRIPVPQ